MPCLRRPSGEKNERRTLTKESLMSHLHILHLLIVLGEVAFIGYCCLQFAPWAGRILLPSLVDLAIDGLSAHSAGSLICFQELRRETAEHERRTRPWVNWVPDLSLTAGLFVIGVTSILRFYLVGGIVAGIWATVWVIAVVAAMCLLMRLVGRLALDEARRRRKEDEDRKRK